MIQQEIILCGGRQTLFVPSPREVFLRTGNMQPGCHSRREVGAGIGQKTEKKISGVRGIPGEHEVLKMKNVFQN